MPDQNINIGRSIEFFAPKDLGNIKRKKFRSVRRSICHGAAFVSLPKGENR
jgi:hypothetical protein